MKRMLGAAGVVLLLAAPLLTGNPFFQHLLIMVLFWTLLGAAWNLLGGFAGQVSFGHAAFLGIGAYTTMIFYLKLGWSPWLGMLAGACVGALFALPIGLICFRLRGPYFSLATLAVAEIVAHRRAELGEPHRRTGGLAHHDAAADVVRRPRRSIGKARFLSIIVAAVLTLVAMGLTISSRARGSAPICWRCARTWTAPRRPASTRCARASSRWCSPPSSSVSAAASTRSISGTSIRTPCSRFRYSVEMVFIAVVGGLATTGGPIVGAIFLVTLSEIFRDRFQFGHLIFYGLFMMLVIRYMPEGIWGRVRRLLSPGAGGR